MMMQLAGSMADGVADAPRGCRWCCGWQGNLQVVFKMVVQLECGVAGIETTQCLSQPVQAAVWSDQMFISGPNSGNRLANRGHNMRTGAPTVGMTRVPSARVDQGVNNKPFMY